MPSEKKPILPRRVSASSFRPIRRTRSPYITLAMIAASLYLLYHLASLCGMWRTRPRSILVSATKATAAEFPHMRTADKLVPLEAHVMSRCPDAQECMKDLVLPTMEQVSDKVDFTLSFIGNVTDDGGIACKHGPQECLGDIIELCAQELYPDPKIHLGFTYCLFSDYEDVPQRSLIEDCALEHDVDFNKLNECATKDDGAYGMTLLRNSVQRSKAAGVIHSCTVRLDGQFYCVRDGGEWVNCTAGADPQDLIKKIEGLADF